MMRGVILTRGRHRAARAAKNEKLDGAWRFNIRSIRSASGMRFNSETNGRDDGGGKG